MLCARRGSLLQNPEETMRKTAGSFREIASGKMDREEEILQHKRFHICGFQNGTRESFAMGKHD
jgi:hypothetical protein